MTKEEAKINLDLARSGAFGENRRHQMLKVIDQIYDVHEAELKAKDTRISELDKELATMHEVSVNLQKSRQKCLEHIEELEAMVEKMKCCENCEYYPPRKCGKSVQYGCSDDGYDDWRLKNV